MRHATHRCGSPRPGSIPLLVTLLAACTSEVPAPPVLPDPSRDASPAFWRSWGDGKAELSGYRLTTPRYGATRHGVTVLIYVTEDMDRRTWIKDDRGEVPAEHRVAVLKLNHVIKFRTGIYPYSLMTSVFSPVDGTARERFAPTKISFSSQEWCGNVFHLVWPEADRFRSDLHSYFSIEGDVTETVDTGPSALYEDALLIQLRELDGAFAAGGDWAGTLVPALWSRRKAHEALRPVPATLSRTVAERDGTPVTRFVLRYEHRTRTFDVERKPPRRILGWTTSDGERADLLKTMRLPYWRLSGPGDESILSQLGISLGSEEIPSAPDP